MKQVISFIFFLLIATGLSAQFADTASLNAYIRDTIRDRRPDKVTAAQLQKGLLGIVKFIPINTTLNSTQVGYGSSTNTLTGSSGFTFNATTNNLNVGGQISSNSLNINNTGGSDNVINVNSNSNSFKRVTVINSSAGAASGAGSLYINDVGAILQYYVGSSTNAFVPNGTLFRTTGAGGFNIAADNGPIAFSKSAWMGAAEFARFTTDGKFGIGSMAPYAKLHVKDADPVALLESADDHSSYLRFAETTGSPLYLGGFMKYDGSINTFQIGTHDAEDTTQANDIPVINIPRAGGKVGINTANPYSTFQVKDGSPLVLLESNDDSQSYLRFVESEGSPIYLGGFIKYDGSINTFQIGTHDASDTDPGTDIPVINILRAGGQVGIGQTAPTAALHLKAGTATAGTAPLKLTSGTLLTTPEAGAVEYDGTGLFFTNSSGVRHNVASTDRVFKVYPDDFVHDSLEFELLGWDAQYIADPTYAPAIAATIDIEITVTGGTPAGTVISAVFEGQTVYTLTVTETTSTDYYVIGTVKINQDIKYDWIYYIKGAAETINGSGLVSTTNTAYRFDSDGFSNPMIQFGTTSSSLARIGCTYTVDKKQQGRWIYYPGVGGGATTF